MIDYIASTEDGRRVALTIVNTQDGVLEVTGRCLTHDDWDAAVDKLLQDVEGMRKRGHQLLEALDGCWLNSLLWRRTI